jgi:hypothetical protein
MFRYLKNLSSAATGLKTTITGIRFNRFLSLFPVSWVR